MNLLTPWIAAGAAAVAFPLLLLLYFLKLRRVEMPISSTLLWKRAIQDLQVNAPFQKLRRNLLLFLQLMILALATFALAGPISRWTERTAGKVVLLIDHSASMNAQEGNISRLDLAKDKALEYVRGLQGNDQVTVIEFADVARAVCQSSTDRGAIRRAIESIQPTDGGTRLDEALKLAVADTTVGGHQDPSLAPREAPDASIELFSDGRIADADAQIVQRGAMRFFPIGSSTDNVGIVTLDVRRAYERPSQLMVFAQIENFGPTPIETDVSLRLNGSIPRGGIKQLSLGPAQADGRIASPGEAPAPSARGVAFELEHESGGILEVVIHREDSLAVDNVARASIDPPRELSVLVVTERNYFQYFLGKALRGLPIAQTEWMGPSEYEQSGESALIGDGRARYDLVIFDNHQTAKLPPGGYLFFGGGPRIEGVEIGELIENDQVVTWDETHPLMRYVTLDNVYIRAWYDMKLPAHAVPLIEGERSVVTAYVPMPGRQFVLCAFELAETDWPMRVPFVVFLYNVTRFFSGEGAGQAGTMVRPGQTIIAPLMQAREEALVERPDGQRERVTVAAGRPVMYPRTDRAGVYTLSSKEDAENVRFTVNLLDRNESRIAPRTEGLSVGAEKVTRAATDEKINQPLWPYLMGAVLAVLFIEWWIYNRRVML
ncbi:MAG: VWA domain-containing protein [Phycisphaerae bacterium]|nr:VWA domain-containing protein [Phycisphaerae bacterium]